MGAPAPSRNNNNNAAAAGGDRGAQYTSTSTPTPTPTPQKGSGRTPLALLVAMKDQHVWLFPDGKMGSPSVDSLVDHGIVDIKQYVNVVMC